jgi:hypothetical protein
MERDEMENSEQKYQLGIGRQEIGEYVKGKEKYWTSGRTAK